MGAQRHLGSKGLHIFQRGRAHTVPINNDLEAIQNELVAASNTEIFRQGDHFVCHVDYAARIFLQFLSNAAMNDMRQRTASTTNTFLPFVSDVII